MRISLVLTLLLLVVQGAVARAAQYEFTTDQPVIAFADVHGAFDDWVALLKELGVVDQQLNWSGGRRHLVSLGDLIDRGPKSRQVVELLMKLESQAAAAGGAVHLVLGNHEVMVMSGDLRYVSGPEFEAFVDNETAAEREQLWQDYRRYNSGGDEAAVRQAFDRDYPRGYVGLRKAFAPDGALGRWLMQKPLVLKINDKVYMHGGISQAASEKGLSQLNDDLRRELVDYLQAMASLRQAGVLPWHVDYDHRLDFLNARAQEFTAANRGAAADWFGPLKTVFDAQQSFVFGEDSPNWYRGTALCHPYSESFNTERFLHRVGARQLVVGHTPTRGRVRQRMEGLAIRLDTGMLKSVYKGRASALVSHGAESYVHYLGQQQKAQPLPEERSLSRQLSGMSDSELEAFMLEAPITHIEDIGTGVTKPKRVTQERGGVKNDAVFKYEDTNPGLESKKRYISRKFNDSDRYVYDVAAYKLDRLFGLEMVPVAVLREVDGEEGALSDWVGNAINERDRLEEDLPFNSYCKQWEQYRLRFVFDILIHNDDRNLTNILWSKSDYMLRFIDHTLAFRSTVRRPKQYRKVDLQVSSLLRSKLAGLTEARLEEALAPYLHPTQIEAILARRDLILKEAVRPSDRK